MMERIFGGKICNSDELTIKYVDDDGDKITLLNDSDLTVALHFHKILRLFVAVNGQERVSHVAENAKQGENLIDAKEFRNELKDIRTSVQTILDRLQLSSTNDVSVTKSELDTLKQSNQPHSITPESNQLNNNHEHPSSMPNKVVDTHPTPSADNNQALQNQFQPMPTPHFAPSGYSQEQQVKANLFGPPPTTFPGMPTPPNPSAPRFPPANTAGNNAPVSSFPSAPTPPPLSTGSTSGFLSQSGPAVPPQQGGFYAQQQAASPLPPAGSFYAQQQATAPGNFNPTNAYSPQQPPTSNPSPATINPSFPQPGPPPMAFQQPYGAYSQQNAYYNPMQPYPK